MGGPATDKQPDNAFGSRGKVKPCTFLTRQRIFCEQTAECSTSKTAASLPRLLAASNDATAEGGRGSHCAVNQTTPETFTTRDALSAENRRLHSFFRRNNSHLQSVCGRVVKRML